MRITTRRFLVALTTAVSTFACVVEEHDSADEQVATMDQHIINGTVPAPGELVERGVVAVMYANVTGASGTLLTNRHVLTCHHCVRGMTDKGWDANQFTGLSVKLDDGLGDPRPWGAYGQTAIVSRIIEGPGPWPPSLDAGDYAILELDRPFSINGSTDGFFNPIYPFADSTLLNQSVFCAGYGWTVEATPTNVASIQRLTYATMTISAVTEGSIYRRDRVSDVVGYGGDSGSTCFLNGYVTGVQSTCHDYKYYDVNKNGKQDEPWGEQYDVQYCNSVSAGNFRDWANEQILTDATVGYKFVPTLPAGTLVFASVASVVGTSNVQVNGSAVLSDFAARSGRLDVSVINEPAHTMCPTLHMDTPLVGSAVLTGTCLDDGLVSVLTTPI